MIIEVHMKHNKSESEELVDLTKELNDQVINYKTGNSDERIKITKRIEKTFTIGEDCIKTIENLSQYLDTTESDIIEYCFRHPEKLAEIIISMVHAEIIKNQIKHYNTCYKGKLISDDLFSQKGDIACKVGGCKWNDETLNDEKPLND